MRLETPGLRSPIGWGQHQSGNHFSTSEFEVTSQRYVSDTFIGNSIFIRSRIFIRNSNKIYGSLEMLLLLTLAGIQDIVFTGGRVGTHNERGSGLEEGRGQCPWEEAGD